MLKIAKIIDVSVLGFIRKFKVKLYGANDAYMEQFGCGGNDYAPPSNIKVLSSQIGNNPRDGVVFLYQDKIKRKSQAGEKRIYSTDAEGMQLVAEIYLKNDGKLLLSAKGNVDIISEGQINLGTGGKAIARVGDAVEVEGKIGKITSGGNNTSV